MFLLNPQWLASLAEARAPIVEWDKSRLV
jgi:hypothetical protein